MSYRCGIGYDLHRLAEGRKLIIGGIEVPYEKGPVGHSDGDVVAHALCDALLGAAGLGDIGTHFPDSDPQWKGANSLLFLEHARKLLDEKHFVIEYVDAVVILERPKLGPHFPKMREALAKSLRVPVEKIHLKAKTNEGVDAVGRGEAIAATLSPRSRRSEFGLHRKSASGGLALQGALELPNVHARSHPVSPGARKPFSRR